MALPIRRRWLWLLGLFALLVILTYGLARLTDEPLRRYMEYRVNQRLTGYTVQMRALHVHPWTVSFDLENATILQDANPDPPVANITKLTVSVDWQGPPTPADLCGYHLRSTDGLPRPPAGPHRST